MSDDKDHTTQRVQLTLPAPTTVLIVDDDSLVLARLQELVIAAGYSVRTAPSGDAALQSLAMAHASIVITDINMPEMGGLELCRTIRKRTWPGYIYIVLLTVRHNEVDVLAGLDAGADDYLSKRTSTSHFIARLRTAQRILALEYSLTSALEKNRRLAMSDALTGVFNRRYFCQHLSRELKRAQRFGGDVSLLSLDVDQFKLINDTYGHAVGDIVLRSVSAQIEASFRRATDWCARLGGDEFAVVLGGTRLADARHCAEKLRRKIASARIETPAGPVCVTVSIGISALEEVMDRIPTTVESLLDHADAKLYASKANGRNCVTSASSKVVRVGTHISAKGLSSHAIGNASVCSVR
jgi:two-component system, cell cycle response regulator